MSLAMKRLLFCAGLLLLAACGPCHRTLERDLEQLATTLPEARIGIAVRTPDGETVARQDTLLPLLSVFKFPLALAVLDKAAAEGTPLTTPVEVGPEWLDPDTYSPLRDSLSATGGRVTLGELLRYSTSLSDNIACDRLLAYVGGPDAVERYVRERAGITGFRIAATERTMHLDPANQRINVARPSAVCALFARFLEGDLLAPEHNALLRQLLEGATTGANKLRAGLPEGVVLGHKTGSSDRTPEGLRIADNDAGYIVLPDGRRYCVTVLVTDSPADDASNAAVIAAISKRIYAYFTENQ